VLPAIEPTTLDSATIRRPVERATLSTNASVTFIGPVTLTRKISSQSA